MEKKKRRSQEGQILFRHETKLSEFLEQFLPSTITNPEIFWIAVINPKSRKLIDDELNEVSFNEEFFYDRWRHLKANKDVITLEDIKGLAVVSRLYSGKWIIEVKVADVDKMWKLIANKTVESRLGTAAKVTTSDVTLERIGKKYLIYVYTSDFTNEVDLKRVEAELRRIGITAPMVYRPEIYKYMGVYIRNEWSIPRVFRKSDRTERQSPENKSSLLSTLNC